MIVRCIGRSRVSIQQRIFLDQQKIEVEPPMKSTIDQIRHRFGNDVERFSDLETGQLATVDVPLVLRGYATFSAFSGRSAARGRVCSGRNLAQTRLFRSFWGHQAQPDRRGDKAT
jgi:hypothetical protein